MLRVTVLNSKSQEVNLNGQKTYNPMFRYSYSVVPYMLIIYFPHGLLVTGLACTITAIDGKLLDQLPQA